MTTKEDAIQFVKMISQYRILTRDELQSAYDSGSVPGDDSLQAVQGTPEMPVKSDVKRFKKLGIAEVLSYIGGAIVFMGIAILIAQNWSIFGFFTKVLVTLGSGVAAYIVGVLFSNDSRTEPISPAFHLISALVTPIGLYVVFDNAGLSTNSFGVQALISAILVAAYVASYIIYRKSIFALFGVIFGTWLFFSLTSMITDGSSYLDTWQFYQYRILAAGITYMLLGYSFTKTSLAALSNFLNGFGVFMFLASALSLGGWSPSQNIFWELVYPMLIAGVLYLSVSMRSNSFLIWGSLFLMAYILKITSEYFASGLGWPFSLVIAGLSMIGVGYMSLNIKSKYLAKK